MHGRDNPSFIGDSIYTIPGEFRQSFTQFFPGKQSFKLSQDPPAQFQAQDEKEPQKSSQNQRERDSWGKGIEFLLSCIAMSVGLGNIWRFPFVALGEFNFF